MPTAVAKPSAVASTDPGPRSCSGVATPVAWCHVGAFPELTAFYEWRDDLWWPNNAAGELLAALERTDPRALARL